MRQLLEVPAEFGDTRLAPTTELAGLAELANLRHQDDRLAAIVRIAATIAQEDNDRAHVAAQRAAARDGLLVLPKRGA
jgi:hypothetical protein